MYITLFQEINVTRYPLWAVFRHIGVIIPLYTRTMGHFSAVFRGVAHRTDYLACPSVAPVYFFYPDRLSEIGGHFPGWGKSAMIGGVGAFMEYLCKLIRTVNPRYRRGEEGEFHLMIDAVTDALTFYSLFSTGNTTKMGP